MKQDNLLRLLILGESSNDAEYILNVLRKGGYATRPTLIEHPDDLDGALSKRHWDLMITTERVGRYSAMDILDVLGRYEHDIPVIVIANQCSEDKTLDVLRAGAKDCIPKGYNRHLVFAVGRELENLQQRRRRRRCESNSRELRRRNKALLEASQDAVAYVLDGMHIHANPVYAKLFGFEDIDELEGMPIMDLVASEDQARFKGFMQDLRKSTNSAEHHIELKGLASTGGFSVAMEFVPASFEGEACHQVVARDLSRAEDLEKLDLIARQDTLTGLYSHTYFLERLEAFVAAAVETERRGFLLYVEIDDFGPLNESVGIAVSDKVIQHIARVIQGCIAGDAADLARFSDFAFTVLCPLTDADATEKFAQRILEGVRGQILEIDAHSVATTCSIGMAPITETSPNAQEILTRASNACTLARKAGGNRLQLYERLPETRSERAGAAWLAEEIRTAIADRRTVLLFQPIVSLHGKTEEIYEARLRVYDRNGEPILIDDLNQMSEEAAVVTEFDHWVVDSVLGTLAERKRAGHDTRLFVKLSDQAIQDETMVLAISKKLKQHGLSGDSLVFELNETSAMVQVKRAKAFTQGLKQIHCRTALDYFGSGLNSFKLLEHVAVDYLKFDGSFIRGLVGSPENQHAIRVMLEDARQLGRRTVAPQVEDANSLAILWQCGVDYAQGDYIAEPGREMGYEFVETEQ